MPELTSDLLRAHTGHHVRMNTDVLFAGVRTDRGRAPSVLERARAAQLLYPDGVLCGYTAAYFHHAKYTADKPTEIVVPRKVARRGILIRRTTVPAEDIVERNGLRLTSAARTAVDLARYVPGDEAIAAVDQMLHGDGYRQPPTTVEAISDYVEHARYLRSAARAAEVLTEADERAESPWETFTRLLLHRAGLGFFVPQTPILDGRFRLDLGAAEYGVAVEYDGEYHRNSVQHRRDVERWNAIQHDQGWALVLATASSITTDRDRFLARVRRALADRGWRAGPEV